MVLLFSQNINRKTQKTNKTNKKEIRLIRTKAVIYYKNG
jgi:hypothetical protein